MSGLGRLVLIGVLGAGVGAGAAMGVSAAAHSSPPPSPAVRACTQLAAANVLTHASRAQCIACTLHGDQYVYYAVSPIGWQCDRP